MPLLAGLGPLGVPELLIIAFIVILVFGVGRLPEVGGAVGKGIREFRKATKDDEAAANTDASTLSETPSADAPGAQQSAPSGNGASASSESVFCSECGGRNARGARFCAECGKPIATPVA